MVSNARKAGLIPIRLAVVAALLAVSGLMGPRAGAQAAATRSSAAAAAVAADGFTAVNPTRVMDTRSGLGGGRFAAGETRTVATASAGMPDSGVSAVALNVTVVDATAPGFLVLFQGGTAQPPTSSLNFAAGEVRANAVVVAVDSTGQVAVFNAAGTADVVIDVTGWFGAGLHPVTPTRLLDTRTTTAFSDGETRTVPVAGVGGVPSSGATAVVVTVTVTNPSALGFLSVWPDGSQPPGSSSVNFGRGETVAATVLIGLGTTGGISIVVSGARTDVLVDVTGWFSTGYDALVQPARLLDTRSGAGSCGLFLGPDEVRTITVVGAGGVPASGVGAAVLNLTVTDATDRGGASGDPWTPSAGGVLTVWPAGQPRPLASNLNYRPGQTVANTVLVGTGIAGQVSIANLGGTIELIVDVNGSFPGTTLGGTPAPCPPLTSAAAQPVPGRFMPDGTIATTAFNLTVAGLGDTAVTRSPVRLALALTGTSASISARIQAVTGFNSLDTTTVVIDTDRLFDDSVGGTHHEVRLQAMGDGTYRVLQATWGYRCLRRASPPFSPELCP